ncbi:translation elongation factor Ts [Patescibacteria group bacterium]|nr:translation elongation factor Ts [Patescibacteria group bacterium]
MPEITLDQIKQLRAETSAGVMDVKRALQESSGDVEKARKILQEQGIAGAAKRSGREVLAGLVHAYIHGSGTMGALVEINCETDFVARTDEFKNLAHEVAMQVTAMGPKSVEELLGQECIKDPGKKVSELIKAVIAKTGENIVVRRVTRYAINDSF